MRRDILYIDAERQDLTALQEHLRQGANVDTKSVSNPTYCQQTALHTTCRNQDLVIAQVLLQAHANPNTQDVLGGTLLHIACKVSGHPPMVRLLLEFCAHTGPQNLGDTPLHLTCRSGNNWEIVQLPTLVRAMQVGSHRCIGPVGTVIGKLPRPCNAEVNIVNEHGRTPLHYAVECSNESKMQNKLSITKELMRRGANVTLGKGSCLSFWSQKSVFWWQKSVRHRHE